MNVELRRQIERETEVDFEVMKGSRKFLLKIHVCLTFEMLLALVG
jgi:hypothetical protein